MWAVQNNLIAIRNIKEKNPLYFMFKYHFSVLEFSTTTMKTCIFFHVTNSNINQI